MGFRVYLRKAVENGKVIFPGNPGSYGFCLECTQHQNGETYKCVQCLRSQKSAHSFACQYMNDPIDADTIEFKPEWIRTFQYTEDVVRQLNATGSIMSIDPAVRLKETNDYTGIVITKVSPAGIVYVVEAIQKKVDPSALMDMVFELVKTYSVQKVLIETISAQVLFLDLFKKEMKRRQEFFVLDEIRTTTKETKAAKIRGLIPYYANGMILHRQGLQQLEDQLIQFPRNTHDDIMDALAQQIPYWKTPLKAAPGRTQTPHGSLNWWKQQTGNSHQDRISRLFGDLMKRK